MFIYVLDTQAQTAQERGFTILVVPDGKYINTKERYINFQIRAEKYLSDSTLKIKLETYKGRKPGQYSFKLTRDKETFIAENYIQQNGLEFELDIPDFKHHEEIILSIGWEGARPDYWRADISLNSPENSEKRFKWKGKYKEPITLKHSLKQYLETAER